MLSHKDCGGRILIPIDGLSIAISSFGISPKDKNLTLNQITLIDEKEGRKTIDVTFMCTKCHVTNIAVEDVQMCCANCGENYTLENIFMLNGGGGFYCKDCKKRILHKDESISEDLFICVQPYFKRKLQL